MDREDLQEFLKFSGLIFISALIWIGVVAGVSLICRWLGVDFFIIL